jgi:hypothetical protein
VLHTAVYGVLVVGGVCTATLAGFELVLKRMDTSKLSDLR